MEYLFGFVAVVMLAQELKVPIQELKASVQPCKAVYVFKGKEAAFDCVIEKFKEKVNKVKEEKNDV